MPQEQSDEQQLPKITNEAVKNLMGESRSLHNLYYKLNKQQRPLFLEYVKKAQESNLIDTPEDIDGLKKQVTHDIGALKDKFIRYRIGIDEDKYLGLDELYDSSFKGVFDPYFQSQYIPMRRKGFYQVLYSAASCLPTKLDVKNDEFEASYKSVGSSRLNQAADHAAWNLDGFFKGQAWNIIVAVLAFFVDFFVNLLNGLFNKAVPGPSYFKPLKEIEEEVIEALNLNSPDDIPVDKSHSCNKEFLKVYFKAKKEQYLPLLESILKNYNIHPGIYQRQAQDSYDRYVEDTQKYDGFSGIGTVILESVSKGGSRAANIYNSYNQSPNPHGNQGQSAGARDQDSQGFDHMMNQLNQSRNSR